MALRRFDEGGDRGFVGGVGDDGRGVSSRRADCVGNRLDLGLGAAADEDVEAFARRHAAHRRPKPFACAHADYDRRLAHAALPSRLNHGAPPRGGRVLIYACGTMPILYRASLDQDDALGHRGVH